MCLTGETGSAVDRFLFVHFFKFFFRFSARAKPGAPAAGV